LYTLSGCPSMRCVISPSSTSASPLPPCVCTGLDAPGAKSWIRCTSSNSVAMPVDGILTLYVTAGLSGGVCANARLPAGTRATAVARHQMVVRFIIFNSLRESVSSNREVHLPPSTAIFAVISPLLSPPHLSGSSGCSPPGGTDTECIVSAGGNIASRRSTSVGQSWKLCASPLTTCCTLPCHSFCSLSIPLSAHSLTRKSCERSWP
jgi:hypothetical protein